jgi:hypothetical protein
MTLKYEFMFEEGYVKDFSKWKSVFDHYRIDRQMYGFIDERIFQDTDNPNHITLVYDIRSKAEALKWMTSDKLKRALNEADAIGRPKFFSVLNTELAHSKR